jgi:hypothetical protein
MVLFLYSDKNCEHQAINCIKSLTYKITDDVKIIYYTIGFKSNFKFKNLIKIPFPIKSEYPKFNYYKAELSLLTMDMFPDEHYIFTDTDVLFSRNFEFEKVKHDLNYPLASFGPHEYPFIWSVVNGIQSTFDETLLMKYCNVSQRSQRYVWSCFYSFNESCRDFFEEYTSFCQNKYLLDRAWDYFPYFDETPFNICLWKRNAIHNLDFIFVNTHSLKTVQFVEEFKPNGTHMQNSIDSFGADWEYIHDASKILLYHGFKNQKDMEKTVEYLLNN